MATFLYLLSFFLFAVLGVNGKFVNGTWWERGARIGTADDFFQFHTRPDLLAPRWNITKHDPNHLAPGYIVLATYKHLEKATAGEAWIGPNIYDQDGELVWSGADLFEHYHVQDVHVAQVGGADMITMVSNHDNAAIILNHHYHKVKKVTHSDAWEQSNMHEFNVLQNGTRALVLTKHPAQHMSREDSKLLGFDGRCLVKGEGLKYLDITSLPPKTLFEWNVTDHVGPHEAFASNRGDPDMQKKCSTPNGWDLHHLNSLGIFPDGDFLLSSRSLSTLFKISPVTGEIVWRLGGSASDFSLAPEARFIHQHHARVRSQNDTHTVITLMDNSEEEQDFDEFPPRDFSAGLMLLLDTQNMVASLIQDYPMPNHGKIRKRGNAQLLPNGNMLMGWADNSEISEYLADGTLLMEGRMLPALDSYRIYKFPWVGNPLQRPDIVSSASLAGTTTYTTAYISWNGATEVDSWALYEVDPDTGHERLLTKAPKHGFETEIRYKGFAAHVRAVALNKKGNRIGKSLTVQSRVQPMEDDQHSPWAAIQHQVESVPSTPIASTVMAALGFLTCVLLFTAIPVLRHYRGRSRNYWSNCEYKSVPLDDQGYEDVERSMVVIGGKEVR